MDTVTINKLLWKVKCFIGTFARDTFPQKICPNKGLIVNTDLSSLPGEHWIAIIINHDGTGEYFDSYGLPPLHSEFIKFMFNNCPNGWIYNDIALQCLACITCGHYCVAYIKLRCHGYTLDEFVSLFTRDVTTNDVLIRNYISI